VAAKGTPEPTINRSTDAMTRFFALGVLVLWMTTSACGQSPVTIEFALPPHFSEGDTQAVLNAVCNGSFTNAVTVDFATTNYTAAAGVDYVANMGTLTFNPGETNKVIIVPLINNGLHGTSRLFRVDLSNPGGGALLGVRQIVYVTIFDNDAGYSIWTSTPSVNENVGAVHATVNRGNDLNSAVSVDYSTTDGSATAGADYTAASGTLTFAAGETSRQIVIPIVNDGLKETVETFRIVLSNPSAGTSLGTANLTITLQDNDPGIEFEQTGYVVPESTVQAVINILRQDDLNTTATVDYFTSNETAVAGEDYVAASGTISFVPGERSKEIRIDLVNDSFFETPERFVIRLINATGGAVLGARQTAGVIIQENDLGFEFGWASFEAREESGSPILLTVVRRQDNANTPATVDYSTENGTAVAGMDYATASGTLSFAPGETSRAIAVTLLNDELVENTEHFTLKLGNPTGGVPLGAQISAVIRIADNETGFEFLSSSGRFPENANEAILTVGHQGDFAGVTTVDFNTVNGSATAGADYMAVSGTLAFSPGETRQEIRVPLLNDGVSEYGESFAVRLSNPTGGATLGTYSTVSVILVDDDPGVSLVASSAEAPENAGVAAIEVRRGSDSTDIVTVEFFTSPGSATSGIDYTDVSGTLTFPPGEMTKFISVPILNDGLIEQPKTFRVSLTNAVGGTGLGYPTTGLWTIRDNDSPISIDNLTLREGTGATNLVVRRGDDGNSSTVWGYSVTGGTAVQGADYSLAAGTLQFPPGPGTLSIPVNLPDNFLVQGEKTIELTLISASPGSTNTFGVVIEDDEEPVVLDSRFRPALSADAGILALACHTNGQLIVSYLDSAQSGYALSRFNADGSSDSSFQPAVTNRRIHSLAIQPNGRLLCAGVFGTNSQLLRLNADGSLDTTFASSLWPSLGTIQQILLQTDGRIVVGAGASVSGAYRITVSRLNTDGSTDGAFMPAVLQSFGSSMLQSLVQQTNGQLVLGGLFSSINGVSRSALARLNADGTLDNTFNPQLSPAIGGSGQASVRDIALQPDNRLLIAGSFSSVNGTPQSKLARLNADGSLDPSFEFRWTNSSEVYAVALQPDGRVLVGGWNLTVFSTPGDGLLRLLSDGSLDTSFGHDFEGSAVYRILICSDHAAYVWGERVTIDGNTIRSLGRVFLDSAAQVGIQFVQAEVPVNEQSGSVTLAVERLGSTTGSLTVNYETVSGTAASGQDFAPQTGMLTFNSGERLKSIVVPILDDGVVEEEETFRVNLLSSGPEVLIGFAHPATVRILDNEVPLIVNRRFRSELSSSSRIVGLLVQSDGKILVTGFLYLSDESSVRYLLRLKADGSLDEGFRSDFATNTQISAWSLITGNRILVAGDFPGGVRLARLNSDGTRDPSFMPAPEVRNPKMIVVQPDGRILVLSWCGPLLRLNEDGSLDASFAPEPGQMDCTSLVAVQPDGKILVVTLGRLIRLNADGLPDPNFHSPVFTTENSDASQIGPPHVHSDGKIWIGGAFTHVDGVPRGSIVRLSADGAVDTTFAPVRGVELQHTGGAPRPGTTHVLAPMPDGRIVVSGRFNLVEGVARPFVARLNPDGSLDTSFGPIPIKGASYYGGDDVFINAVASTTGGNVLISGEFLTVDGMARPGLVEVFGSKLVSGAEFTEMDFNAGEDRTNALVTIRRLGDVSGAASVQFAADPGTATEGADFTGRTGTLTFAPLETSKTFTIPLLDDGLDEPDETVILTITSATGISLVALPQADLRILDNDRAGSLDTTFGDATALLSGAVSSQGLAVQSDGRVLVSGSLELGTNDYRGLIRLNADGSLDSTFSVADPSAFMLASLPDDRIIAVAGNALIRLRADGARDAGFYAPFNGWVRAAAVQMDGKIVAAGSLWDIQSSRNRGFIERLNPDGSRDPGLDWFGAEFSAVNAILPAGNGQLLIAGTLSDAYQQGSALTRLNADGSRDPTFSFFDDIKGSVNVLFEQEDGRIIVGGSFTVTQGTNSTAGVARFHQDGTLDTTFLGGSGATVGPQNWPAQVIAIAQQFNGKLVVAGSFTRFHGVERAGLARLNPNGTLDTSFDPGEGPQIEDERYGYYSGSVNALVLLANGQLLAGGWFNEFNGAARNGVARVNGDFPAELTPLSLGGDGFRFGLTTQLLRTYVIEVSEDLAQWTPVSTNTARANTLVFDDPDAPAGPRLFYRAVRR
jgi:uncharacterized delta-60 repeat protein